MMKNRIFGSRAENKQHIQSDYDFADLHRANSCIVDSIKESYILLKGDEDELQRLFAQYD